jgi:hypothetical protein
VSALERVGWLATTAVADSVSWLDVRGPFSVLAGNHAVGGSIQYTTDAARASSFNASVDSFGRVRVLPIGNLDLGPGGTMNRHCLRIATRDLGNR